MNEITQVDNDRSLVMYFSDDSGGSGAADASTGSGFIAGLNNASGDGTDRVMAVEAWWSVDGSVSLGVSDGAGAPAFTQIMDFAGNSGGWVQIPRILFDTVEAGTDGDFEISNPAGINFSLSIRFDKTGGFSNRPRMNRSDGAFDRNR